MGRWHREWELLWPGVTVGGCDMNGCHQVGGCYHQLVPPWVLLTELSPLQVGNDLMAPSTKVLFVAAAWTWWHLVIRWYWVGGRHCERVPLLLPPSQMPPRLGGRVSFSG